ncbi:DNA-directed RNA polymerase subunit alpha [Candidatus Magnetoovum chiemensis]|nr:DNA-directed RNA polymerase subunit alpha [Candidatus Magnetoovum chiemensis]
MIFSENGFHLPESIYLDEETLSDTYGKLIAEPLERGYGITIGNALRRVLLSSIEGAAITSITLDNVNHEFSTIKGVKEDVIEILLNLKKVRLKYLSDQPVKAYINVKNKHEITAGDITFDGEVQVLNKDFYIASIDDNTEFNATLTIKKGRGYIPAEELKEEHDALNSIAIDAIFTPIEKVIFNVEKTRVGKSTDYDKLIIELWTDGSVTPKEAIQKAIRILIQHLKLFLIDEDEIEDETSSLEEEKPSETALNIQVSDKVIHETQYNENKSFNKNLLKTVDELELSVRSMNCLKNADIKYLYQLVDKSEHDMLKMKNFGRKSLTEIREILTSLGLDFNMRIDYDAVQKELTLKNGG